MPAQKNPNQDPTQQPAAQTSTSKSTEPHRGRWLGFGFGLAGVAMLSATAGALLAVSLSTTPLQQQKLTPEEAAVFSQGDMAKLSMKMPELTRPVNILVLGLKVLSSDINGQPDKDKGYEVWENSFKGLTDTMLLVRFDPQNKKLSVLSIPRDTRAYVEGRGEVKINEANYYGGPASSAKSVSGLLGGVGIDRYVTLNIQGIKSLVDAIGGITINVPKDMKYTDESQHLYIDLKAGKQHLNGEQIVQYLLYRHDNLGDIGRVQRQQLLMRAFVEQEVNVGLLSRLPNILSVIQSHIDTNLSIEELVALAGFAIKTDRSSVQMLMVPGKFSDAKDYKASYWLPDQNAIETLVAEHFDFGQNTWTIENADATFLKVAIQDSTGNQAAVEEFVKTLTQAGYRNVHVYKDWPEALEVTTFVAQDGDIKGAQAIRQSLGFGDVLVESTGSLQSDVTIRLGKDWLSKKSQSGRGF
ncbi:MAG: LCP family protein [Tychonema bourrellyi B0820]|uniref:LytR family transcriptional regulator n=1 Tax=Tychonema bourrellyi FEM_GT703 TaxID=2040638 RepID=A0A2G4F4Z4_9CYAN|nr:LCP family protein [Tychonema bourrellyi]MDQ2097649.1 LCP family protein [Tychonema bourrellyi B0820]PHX56781.1 LytR family transcriptional regulator [Tychonema bourrellyi FEM_GT703]